MPYLGEFPGLTLTYRPGKENLAADCLARNSAHRPTIAAMFINGGNPDSSCEEGPLRGVCAGATRTGRVVQVAVKAQQWLKDRPRQMQKGRRKEQQTNNNRGTSNRTGFDSRRPQSIRGVAAQQTTNAQRVVKCACQPNSDDLKVLDTRVPFHFDVGSSNAMPIHVHVPLEFRDAVPEEGRRVFEDTCNLQQAHLMPAPIVGTAKWEKALEECPIYGHVFSEARARPDEELLLQCNDKTLQSRPHIAKRSQDQAIAIACIQPAAT